MKTFFATLRQNDMRFVRVMITAVVAAAAVAVSAVLMTRLTGDMGQAALDFDVDRILGFLLLLTGIMLLRAVSAVVLTATDWRFWARAGFKFRENFCKHLLRAPFAAFEKRTGGDNLSLLTNDIPQASRFVTEGTFGMVADILSVTASFVFMLTINWGLTLIFFAMFPLLVVLQVVISKPIQKRSLEMNERRGDFNSVVNDSLQNVSTIVAYSLEDVLEQRYLRQYDRFMQAMKKFVLALLVLVMGGIAATIIPTVLINIWAAFAVVSNDMTIAEFIAFTGVAITAGQWLMMLSQRLTQLQANGAGAVRFNEATNSPTEPLKVGETLGDMAAAHLAFDNVSFSYNGEGHMALTNVSFEIKAGSKVAIVGTSGSGKTTVLKLLMGLYEPKAGVITIEGVDTSKLGKAALRGAFAYVPQDSFLFPESIGANIYVHKEDFDQAKLDQVCKDAGIYDFIQTLPKGYDSVLTEAAENISGGQRQRIAMARAFYRNAPVILFDEATSALDPATEGEVLESFRLLARGKTVIMVAHRAKAIAACDTIIVMDKGKISGIGSHEELLNGNDVYAKLYAEAQA